MSDRDTTGLPCVVCGADARYSVSLRSYRESQYPPPQDVAYACEAHRLAVWRAKYDRYRPDVHPDLAVGITRMHTIAEAERVADTIRASWASPPQPPESRP